jgi:GNAT superfamily N-acetyltransferase
MPFSPITNTDLLRIKDLQPKGWGDIVDSFEMYLTDEIFNPVKTEDGGLISSIANSTNYGNTAWLSHIIVREEFRGRGLGMALVNHLLEDLDSKGVETVSLIATEMGRPLYLKAGFRDQAKYLIFKGQDSSFSGKISPYIEPYDEKYSADILKIDKKVMGEDRPVLMGKHLKRALVFRHKGIIEGYYLPGLGEGPIAALNPEAGLALLEYKLLNNNRVVLPAENSRGVKFLLSRNFIKEKITLKRMVRGREFSWRPDCLYSRMGGKLG